MPQVADVSQIRDSTLAQGLLYRTISEPSYQLATCRPSATISSESLTTLLLGYLTSVQSQIAEQLRTLEAAQRGKDSTEANVLQRFNPSRVGLLASLSALSRTGAHRKRKSGQDEW